MTVEKMSMLSAIGYLKDIDAVSSEMVNCGCVHLIDAMDDIRYNLSGHDNDAFEVIEPYKNYEMYDREMDKLLCIMEILDIDDSSREKYLEEDISVDEISGELDSIYREAVNSKEQIDDEKERVDSLSLLSENLENIEDVKTPLYELRGLNFFRFGIGRFRRENYAKLKQNIENIHSIIYETSRKREYITVISFTPMEYGGEIDEIFRSLGYENIDIPEDAKGVPRVMISRIEDIIENKKNENEGLIERLKQLKEEKQEFIKLCSSVLQKHKKMQYVDSKGANSAHLFYLSGWVPESKIEGLEEKLGTPGKKIAVFYRPDNEVKGSSPPTKLNNNGFFSPFEYFVKMYDVPSYKEIDPTPFVAISYMIMFGVMFGDVGQGLVLTLGGLALSRMTDIGMLGGILIRAGIGSIVFGFLYGSIFGEDILKPLLLRPIENINTILLLSVILGILLSTVGYILNFINSVRMKNVEEGLFGREGGAGFLFYVIALITFYMVYRYGKLPVPISVVFVILGFLLLVIVLKEPLSRLIEGEKPLHRESIGDYYIESIFGVLETLLGMLSKTISFVRLGAFALNHAGLFAAFATISGMMKSKTGSVGILILGNIIIIGLEGLVVFIQGLRLEYYELFSRFFRGDGIEYKPVRITDRENS